jgi:hypothetical protein
VAHLKTKIAKIPPSNPGPSVCTHGRVFTVTTTSTLTQPAITECDGLPRATSIGETVITTVTSVADPDKCLVQPRNKEELQKPKSNWLERAPRCRIPQTECVDSWKLFREAFQYRRSWDRDSLIESSNDDEIDSFCLGKPEDACFKTEWNSLITAAGITLESDHLFADCPNIQPYIRKEWLKPYVSKESEHGEFNWVWSNVSDSLPPDVLASGLDSLLGCKVFVDAFVLLFFPPDTSTARDICTSSGYGEFIPYRLASSLSNPAVSAVVSTIVFDQHDRRLDDAAISEYALMRCTGIYILTIHSAAPCHTFNNVR